ncbi:MAG: hypothetical protein DHS20C01_18130 [marine bacterium B5-7]|nr:MAG: hypothetical protein DHS20C01_18130 [marine bacterium B5-7]
MTNNTESYEMKLLWPSAPGEFRDEIVNFWLKHGALPQKDQADARLSEVAMLALDSSGAIAAASSIFSHHYPPLGHAFYFFRCFVHPDHRRAGLAVRLINEVYDHLDIRFKKGSDPSIIGMIAAAENPMFNREHNEAIWPRSGFVFVGYNARGQQVRVRYFSGARIASKL